MRILVTGGGGFLGSHVVRALLERGHQLRSFSRGTYPELAELGVALFQGDLAVDNTPLGIALEGVDCVVHCAAKAGVFGPEKEFDRANHLGTLKLLQAAQAASIPRFVHTSSPSVCFDGTDHIMAGPDLPIAERFLSPYPKSKAAAEQAVLRANGVSGMHTVALRPHLIFGPGDPHLVPRLIQRAKAKKLIQVGEGLNQVSLTYIENAAWAHVVAAEALGPDSAAAGKAYFVGQKEPVNLWTWIHELLASLGLPPIQRQISAKTAYRLGAIAEGVYKALRRKGDPPMSRFLAQQLASSHSYDMGPLERDLGYSEQVSLTEGTRRTVLALKS